MTERLNELQKGQCAFNDYIKKQKEKKEIQLKLSRNDQLKVQNALINIDMLKRKVKKEMAQERVINLKEK